ncbi:MAG: NlpC/P60 family protein [Aeromicrobium sp.]
MRVFPLALRGLACAGALTLVASSGALAVDDDQETTASIQIRLVEARQRLNSLYDQAAIASERLNGAVYEAQLAKEEVTRNADAVASAQRDLSREQDLVAELTVQDLQSGTAVSRLSALFGSAGPSQLLDRSAAYSSTQEAMAARIAALSASGVVYDSAVHRAAAAEKKRREAMENEVRAKAVIDQAIGQAESAVKDTAAERAALLEKLAKVQNAPLADVSARQDQIDQELDSQPATPTPNDIPAGNPEPKQSKPKPPKLSNPPKPSDPPATQAPKASKPAVVNPPPASASKVDRAIAFARSQLGDPYKWGASGPNSWDCSGLTMKAWAAAGVSLPHYGGAQYTSTRHVSVSSIQRGDLLFWSKGSARSIYHVAIYLGGGQMIHAPRTGRNVEIVSFNYWIRPDLASRPG